MTNRRRNALIFAAWFALALSVIGFGGVLEPVDLAWRVPLMLVSAAVAALLCTIGTLHMLGGGPRFPTLPPM